MHYLSQILTQNLLSKQDQRHCSFSTSIIVSLNRTFETCFCYSLLNLLLSFKCYRRLLNFFFCLFVCIQLPGTVTLMRKEKKAAFHHNVAARGRHDPAYIILVRGAAEFPLSHIYTAVFLCLQIIIVLTDIRI